MEQELFQKRALTRKKVIHKKVSQGFNQIRRSRSKRITQPFHNIKVVYVAFMIILNFIKKIIIHNFSIQRSIYQNMLRLHFI